MEVDLYSIASSKIPGVRIYKLDIREDERGWLKETFDKDNLVSIGFPVEFNPDIHRVSFNNYRGVTRGIHAEPCDKYVSLASGSAFIALADLRSGFSFASIQTYTVDPGDSVYIPRGVANSYQTLEGNTSYTSIVSKLNESGANIAVNLADPYLAIHWPISLSKSVISKVDMTQPFLKDITPIREKS